MEAFYLSASELFVYSRLLLFVYNFPWIIIIIIIIIIVIDMIKFFS